MVFVGRIFRASEDNRVPPAHLEGQKFMDQACRGAEPSGLWMDSVLCSSAGVQCSSEDIERWGTVWVDACNDPLDGVKACEPIQCGVWKTSQMAVNYTKTCGGCDDELFAYFECGIASGIWDWYIVSDDLVTKASGSNPCTWKHGSGAEFQRYTTTYPNKSLHAGSRSRTTSNRRATAAARTAPARRASASSLWSPRWWPPSEKLGRGSRDKKK